MEIKEINIEGYDKVFRFESDNCRGFLAIYDLFLGNPAGGTRYWKYNSEQEALQDALNLSKTMTYKFGMMNFEMSGGKAVIMKEGKNKEKVLEEYGRILYKINKKLEEEHKRFLFTGQDMGLDLEDLDIIIENSDKKYIIGTKEGYGDPSHLTGYNVYLGMKVCALHKWGSSSLKGKKVSIQGLGKTGEPLLKHLLKEEAIIRATDINQEVVEKVRKEHEGNFSLLDSKDCNNIFCEETDIVAPCGAGGTIGKEEIEKSNCSIICGTANNPLKDESLEDYLFEGGILYAPDFCVNAGGAIYVAVEAEAKVNGIKYNNYFAEKEAKQISFRLNHLFNLSKKLGKNPSRIGREIVEEKIALLKEMRSKK